MKIFYLKNNTYDVLQNIRVNSSNSLHTELRLLKPKFSTFFLFGIVCCVLSVVSKKYQFAKRLSFIPFLRNGMHPTFKIEGNTMECVPWFHFKN